MLKGWSLSLGSFNPIPRVLFFFLGNNLKIPLLLSSSDGARVPGGGAGIEARRLLVLASPGNSCLPKQPAMVPAAWGATKTNWNDGFCVEIIGRCPDGKSCVDD